jgi:hypothetical protein
MAQISRGFPGFRAERLAEKGDAFLVNKGPGAIVPVV